jgi:anti-anti-sigma factor
MSLEQPSFVNPHIEVSMRDSQIVVTVSGEQDGSNAPLLLAACVSAIAQDGCDLVIDLRDVKFISAATIGVIGVVDDALRLRSRSLAIESPSTCSRRLLELCDLAAIISKPITLQDGFVERGQGSALATWVEVPPLPPVVSATSAHRRAPTETLAASNDQVPLSTRDGT